MIGIFD
jgi:hypothetical protein